ncbi:AlpA family transcriptional regulator [Chromobacterium sp. ASV23]|uniref:helix-turn-helix transcriptional regulator n=1 Tax=Chromobacterium sp. ASV23 TaxID=2795110 RepID=UPI0018EAAA12|nr:AlpA family phage regulatory protein [Chromobacterium sp. ASV23]
MAKLLTLKGVEEKTGFKKSKIYKMIAAGDFPPQIKCGVTARWLEADIDQWISEWVATNRPKVA